MPMPILKESIQQSVGRLLQLNTRRASLNSCWTITRKYLFLFLFYLFLFSISYFILFFFSISINVATKRTNAVVIQHDQSASPLLSKPSKKPRFKGKGRRQRLDHLLPIQNIVGSCISLKGSVILVSDYFVLLFFGTN